MHTMIWDTSLRPCVGFGHGVRFTWHGLRCIYVERTVRVSTLRLSMSWYELNGNFNVRFGAYRRTSDSYGECYSPAAARTPSSPIRLQPISVGAAGRGSSKMASAMASAMAATMIAPSPRKQPLELHGPSVTPAKPRRATKPLSLGDAKLPTFKLSVDDLTRVAAEKGLPFWTREKLQGLFALFDTDRDNAIDRLEFEYVTKQLLQLIEPPTAQAAGQAEAALPEKLKAFQPLGKVAEVVECVAPLQALDAALVQAAGGVGSSDSSGSAEAERQLSDAKVALAAGIERATPVMARVIKRRLNQPSAVLDCLNVIAAGLDFFEGSYHEIFSTIEKSERLEVHHSTLALTLAPTPYPRSSPP